MSLVIKENEQAPDIVEQSMKKPGGLGRAVIIIFNKAVLKTRKQLLQRQAQR